ncbi:MAG: YceI family protein [Chloroflexi bacterium]|nr:YceI family protein [Chloroflexota bacterium]
MAWNIDPAHSQITFSARHMMITNVRGRFENFSGTVDFDEQRPERTKVAVQVEAASINTREARRDDHLRSPDFFNAVQYPTITFESRRVEVLGPDRARLIGDLTIRDLTREVALDVEYAGQARSPWGVVAAGFSAAAKINRHDWGLNWNVALETGGWLVGDQISIAIELEIQQQPEAVPAAEPQAALA